VSSDSLTPATWYRRPLELVINATIVIAAAVPVMLATENALLAAGVGSGVLMLTNVAYWTLVRDVPLREVYPALKPWI